MEQYLRLSMVKAKRFKVWRQKLAKRALALVDKWTIGTCGVNHKMPQATNYRLEEHKDTQLHYQAEIGILLVDLFQ